MQLHFRGVTVPALGSLRDKVYREYLLHEVMVEAKKQELMLLNTLASPVFSEPGKRREWDNHCREVFDKYISLLIGLKKVPESNKDKVLLDYYENVVKKAAPKLSKDKDGKLTLTDYPTLD